MELNVKLKKWLEEDKYAKMMYYRATGEMDEMECSKQLKRLIKPLYFAGVSILDTGCSCGHYYYSLKKLGDINYTGVDISEKFIDLAKNIFVEEKKAHFYLGDIFNLPFEDNVFDIVFSYNLLAHLPDHKVPVKELIRVASKNVIIRALFDREERKIVEKAGFESDSLIHHNTYCIGEVVEFIKKMGCGVEVLDDDVVITDDILKKQIEKLGVDKSQFTQTDSFGKLNFKGLEYNYKVLKITKSNP